MKWWHLIAALILPWPALADDDISSVHIPQVSQKPVSPKSVGEKEKTVIDSETQLQQQQQGDYQSQIINDPRFSEFGRANAIITRQGGEPLPGGNSAVVNQGGEGGNTAIIKQEGKSNSSSVIQKGKKNTARQTQKGDENELYLNQQGDANFSDELQQGDRNHKVKVQNGTETESYGER